MYGPYLKQWSRSNDLWPFPNAVVSKCCDYKAQKILCWSCLFWLANLIHQKRKDLNNYFSLLLNSWFLYFYFFIFLFFFGGNDNKIKRKINQKFREGNISWIPTATDNGLMLKTWFVLFRLFVCFFLFLILFFFFFFKCMPCQAWNYSQAGSYNPETSISKPFLWHSLANIIHKASPFSNVVFVSNALHTCCIALLHIATINFWIVDIQFIKKLLWLICPELHIFYACHITHKIKSYDFWDQNLQISLRIVGDEAVDRNKPL